MRVVFFLTGIVMLLDSCTSSGITKQLTAADSLVITFNHINTDSVVNSVQTTDKKAIQKIAGFLSKGDSTGYKCGFNGNMIFFNKGEQLLPVVFSYNDNCRYFLYDWENKVTSVKMSNEAVDFLKSLAEGKNWY
ncbi:MAG: hypothetical protein IPM85_07085 [Chitinophagaceae bacterium]|nr:hypothetical protein [Chitinophagaceae bacterium]